MADTETEASSHAAMTRREFGRLAAATSIGVAVGACGGGSGSGAAADLVLLSGNILTVDSLDRTVQAVAARDGRILQTGRDEEIRALAGPATTVIDLQGKTVTPALIDSHIHVLYYGKQSWEGFTDIRIPNVASKADLLRVVGEKAAEIPDGDWISGNQGFLLPIDQAPDRLELDDVAPDNPTYLRHMGGQYGVANTLALQTAGITRFTPNPYGGVIVRDPVTKIPTGLLSHYSAQNLVGKWAPGWGPRTDDELAGDVVRAQDLCLAAGYASGQDVIVGSSRDVQAYRQVRDNGDLKMRMYLLQYVPSPTAASDALQAAEPFQDPMLTFGGWKLAVDGGSSAGTALMYDTTMPMSTASYPYYEQSTLNEMVTAMHKAGYQVAFHCTGDRAIDMAINAIEAALNEAPRDDHRHRIEHVLFPTSDALNRIKQLGIVVSTQPQWLSMLADGYANVSNAETMEGLMPLRTMMDMGIPIAFGCDVPATPYLEPAWAFAGAVTRTTWLDTTFNPDEVISMRDALRMHTMGSAFASFEEGTKGSIEVGKMADMVVWSHDLLTLDPMVDLVDFRAETTIVDGQVVASA